MNEKNTYNEQGEKALDLIGKLEKSLKVRTRIIWVLVLLVILSVLTAGYGTFMGDSAQKQEIAEMEKIISLQSETIEKLESEIDQYQETQAQLQEKINVLQNRDRATNRERAATEVSDNSDFFEHTILPGETLWDLAGKYLEDPYRYSEIARENNIDNPDILQTGITLKIKR
jgi:nucleoid-associated protein YgaU